MSIAAIAALALEAGPTVIRGIASLFGGSETVEKVAQVVDQVDKLTTSNSELKQQALENELQKLSPAELIELEQLKLELEKEQVRRLQIIEEAKQAEHHETQQTIRTGDTSEDEYVRHTRPWGCRLGLYCGFSYVILFETLAAFGKGSGASWELASMFIAPFMTYLGWRTADKRSATKGTGNMVSDAFSAIKGVASSGAAVKGG